MRQYHNHNNKPYFNTQRPWTQAKPIPGHHLNAPTPPEAVTETDFGPMPFVIDIEKAAVLNNNYRTALWTGQHLQLTVMSIPVGGDVGLEIHPDNDQFFRIEQGVGLAQMGAARDYLCFNLPVFADSAVFVPAGTWHNIVNTGNSPLKFYTIYAPPHHAHGTVHATKEIAEREEG